MREKALTFLGGILVGAAFFGGAAKADILTQVAALEKVLDQHRADDRKTADKVSAMMGWVMEDVGVCRNVPYGRAFMIKTGEGWLKYDMPKAGRPVSELEILH